MLIFELGQTRMFVIMVLKKKLQIDRNEFIDYGLTFYWIEDAIA